MRHLQFPHEPGHDHIVCPGDCLASIAHRFGFTDPQVIYNDPENQDLRALRPNPNLLFPGDVVVIPKPPVLKMSLPTGKRHVVVVPTARRTIHVRVLDAAGEPMASEAFTIEAGPRKYEGTSDGDGVVKQTISAAVTSATLTIGDVTLALAVGHLNPLADTDDDGVSGAQARLRNLGYRPGAIDGVLGSKTRAALRLYQEDHGLEVTGELTDETLAALADDHGC
jgi:N-acetylmuramoyl-L-alanine amidase